MTRKEASDAYVRDPDTPLNIPKTAKKEAVRWIVPTLLSVVGLALFIAARSWADDRYTKKEDAAIVQTAEARAMDEEQKKREALEVVQQDINRKLDLIIYVLQNSGQLNTHDMRGKLNQP